jgi:tetratricopeptide (TPR) repeat protein
MEKAQLEPHASPPDPAAGTRGSRRWWRLACALFGLMLLTAGWLTWRWCFAAPLPPEVPGEIVDPAVVEAIDEARRHVISDPRSSSTWGKLGMIFNAYRCYSQASVCFSEAEKLDPLDRRWPYFQGLDVTRRDPARGIVFLKRAAELSGDEHYEPHLRLGEVLLDLGRETEAEQCFRRVLKIEPGCLFANLDLGRLAAQRGDFQGSIPDLEKAAGGPQTGRAATRLLATVYMRLGRTADARRAREEWKRMPEDRPWHDPLLGITMALAAGKQTLLKRADDLDREGNYRDALQIAEDLLIKYPEDAWIYNTVIRELFALQEWDRAKQMIQRAIAAAPAMIAPHEFLGKILFREAAQQETSEGGPAAREKFLAAAECFRRIIDRKSDDANAHFALGQCYRRAGDDERARPAFEEALRCRPDDANVHTGLAELLIDHGRDYEALEHLQYAIKLGLTKDPKPGHLMAALLARTACWR